MPEKLAGVGKIYSGSVKDVFGEPGKSPFYFYFSNRYSIFDWGMMPDEFQGKGDALAVMGDLLFRYLGEAHSWLQWQIPEFYPKFWRDSLTTSATWSDFRKNGMKHHSYGLVDEAGISVPLGQKSRCLSVQGIDRPAARSFIQEGKVHWDYSAYKGKPQNVLVPLEVVFRFGAPEGSSFLQRVENDPSYAASFGFSQVPVAGELFPYPIVEFFTKLEPTDRFLTRTEAQELACLSKEELDDLVATTLLIALRLKEIFANIGLELWDGKFEFSFFPKDAISRGFQLVDSIGPDELRLIGEGGVHFSKEFLRRIYRGTPWFDAVEKSKKIAKERGEKDWKSICKNELNQTPEKLPQEALTYASAIYPSLAEALAKSLFNKNIFPSTLNISDLCHHLKELQ